MSPSSWLKIAALVLVALAVTALPSLEGLGALLDPERLGQRVESAGPAAPLLLMLLMATAVVISPIPSLPIDAAAGAAFGPWLGTLWAALGALGGSVVAFGIARLLGRELVERVVGGHISFCRSCSDRLLFWAVLVARLLPLLSFDVISYGAGLTNLSLSRFALATFAGMLPVTFVAVYLGSSIRIGSWELAVLGALAVAFFLLLPRLVEKHDLFGLRRYFAEHLDREHL